MKNNVSYLFCGQTFAATDDGVMMDDSIFSLEKLEQGYQFCVKNKINLISRPSVILFYQAFYKHNYPKDNFKKID